MENSDLDNLQEAQEYHLKAEFILHELQANMQVYGSNSVISGATPANIDLALQYIDRSLEYFPDNTAYINLKALLLWEGKGQKESATELLERAAELNPRDIDIQNNLEAIKSSSSSCFIATAAFGSPLYPEVNALRIWRDEKLLTNYLGAAFVKLYYFFSPPIAALVSKHQLLRKTTRCVIKIVLKFVCNSKSV